MELTSVQQFAERYSEDESYGTSYACRVTTTTGRQIVGRWTAMGDGLDLLGNELDCLAHVPGHAIALIEYVEYDESQAFGHRWVCRGNANDRY